MNAITLLPYALPALALGTYLMLRIVRWFDRPTMLRQAHTWHNAVVDHERSQGIYDSDGEITDIIVIGNTYVS